MDIRLESELRKLHEQSELFEKVERDHFKLEAHEDVIWSQLFIRTTGTVAEREASTYACQDWIRFSEGLAESKSRFNQQRRMWEVGLKRFDAEYLSFKIQNEAIKRSR